MNQVELFFYNILKKNPKVKLLIRDIYQLFFDCIPVKKRIEAYPVYTRKGYFFGFHDHCPFSTDNLKLAACKYDVNKPLRMPDKNDLLEVGFFDGHNFTHWNHIGITKAWNWHQGCKLQWCGSNNIIAYNDRINGQNVSKFIDISNNKNSTYNKPIGSISPDGNWGVSYNFNRVNTYMPGYGYRFIHNHEELDKKIPGKDGLFIINLKTEKDQLIFSFKDFLDSFPVEDLKNNAFHFFSHTIFSPSSKRFVFLHRWIKNDVRKRWSRLITSDLKGEDIRIYPVKDMVSHLAWRNEKELLAYCRLRDGRDRYVLFNDNNPQEYKVLGEDEYNSDGHPSFSPDQQWFVTDIYPDRNRLQYLSIYNINKQKKYNIARLKTYRKFATVDPYKHWSCDLHPRWDRKGRYICFDSTFNGYRSLCTLDFGKLISELIQINTI